MIITNDYVTRRVQLAKQMRPGAIAIIPAANEVPRSGDTYFRFRQDSDFYYLTGFNEPKALLIIFSGNKGESYLFNRPRDQAVEQWTGKRLGQDDACEALNVAGAYSIEDLDSKLPDLMAGTSAIYYALGRHPLYEKKILRALQQIKGQIRRGLKAPEEICDLEPLLSEMRLKKSEAEVVLMHKAADVSVRAHERTMRACRSLQNEQQLEAELLYEFTRGGCRSVAYDPIVGGGANACILHYTDNNQPLRDGELVLIDAGGEYQNYASDITRTFPVNGRFSPEQRAIYELVLTAQKAGIARVRPGIAWNEIQQAIVKVLTTGLHDLGLLKGDVENLIASEAYKPFYMHNSGHWLGLDVHDAGLYKVNNEWRLLEPGMVLTVEPGLYLGEMTGVAKRWQNIGVRIEDDILVTKNGHDNLTASLAVEIADIEALMRD
jgi:Xaa-Pro aminopeptidase